MARADFSANPDILPRYNSIKMSGPLCYLYTAYLGKVWAVVRGFLRVHSHLPGKGDGMYSTVSSKNIRKKINGK